MLGYSVLNNHLLYLLSIVAYFNTLIIYSLFILLCLFLLLAVAVFKVKCSKFSTLYKIVYS